LFVQERIYFSFYSFVNTFLVGVLSLVVLFGEFILSAFPLNAEILRDADMSLDLSSKVVALLNNPKPPPLFST